MSEQEREKDIGAATPKDEDVEGHMKRRTEGEPGEDDAGMRREGLEEADVEGHMKR